ncbi:MAG: hypothetical protein IT513_16825, partial [Burkholderiales bacterium]|nr:hypothetical protein [Burkholderiales bacterium]
MKRLAWVLLLFSAAVLAEERILSFQSQIQVSPRGALTVLEAIDIQVEGRQVKRGILRDFP